MKHAVSLSASIPPGVRLLVTTRVALAVLVLAIPSAHAQVLDDVRFLPGDDLVGPAVGFQREPAIAAGGGVTLVVWSDFRTTPEDGPPFATEGRGSDIYAMRLDSDGNPLDPEPFPLTEAFGDQEDPRVAWNGTHFLVVWTGPNRTYWDNKFEGVRMTPDGTIVDSTPIHIMGNVAPTHYDLASNGADWAIVYQGSHANDSSVRANRITAAGVPLDPGGIGLITNIQQVTVTIASAGGEYLVTRRNSSLAPQARRYDASFNLLGSPFDLPSDFIGSSGAQYFVVWTSGGSLVGSPMSVTGVLTFPDGVQIADDAGSMYLSGFESAGVAWDGAQWWVSWRHALDGIEVARILPDGTVLDFGGVAVDPGFESDHGLHALAARSGGGAQVAWVDTRNGGSSAEDIFGASVSDVADPGPAGPLSTAVRSQLRADVAVGNGQALVVFHSELAGSRVLKALRVDSDGNALDAEPLTVTTSNNVGAAHAAWNGSLYLVVWSEGKDTYARRLNPDGTFADPFPFLVATDLFDPDAAALGDVFLVVGRKETISSQFVHTFAQRLDGVTGNVIDTAPFQISQYFARHPRVESFGARWLVTWQRNFSHDDPQANAEAAFVEPGGIPGPAFVVEYNGFTPHVAVSDTTAMFVFRKNSSANANNDVKGRVMALDGTFLGDAFVVAAESDRQIDPVVAWNGSEFVTFWTDKRNVTSYYDERTEIFGARIDENGTLIDPQGFSFAGRTRPEIQPAVGGIEGRILVTGSIFRSEPGVRAYRIGYEVLGDEKPGNRWPVARAAADASSGPIPLTVNLDSTGSTDPDGMIVTYEWDFDDGGSSPSPMPEHVFPMVGDHLVRMQVTDDDGSRTTQTILVRARPVNGRPVAVVSADTVTGKAPLSVVYSAAGSYDPDGTIATFYWTFGDGGSYYGGTAYHTYNQAGTFPTTLQLTDDEGATGTATLVIDVDPPNVPPTARILNSLMGGPAPLPVLFDASASNDPDGSISTYDWRFGDGGTSSETAPSYTYGGPGSFTVTLTVTDTEGGTGNAQVTIDVVEGENYGVATADHSTTLGSVMSGSYIDTQVQDDVVEELHEETTGGNPSSRRSMLEHTWTLDVEAGRYQVFYINAWHTANGEGDEFVFEYSRDQVAWTAMLTVTDTLDDGVFDSYSFNEDVAGVLYVRVRDLDRTVGNASADSLYIDNMYVLSTPSMGHLGTVPDDDSAGGLPLYVDKATDGDLSLSWGESCMASDLDYGVYEGRIGDFTAHLPVVCSTGGATNATITPSAGATYYLVVTNDGAYEGAYGQTSGGSERSAGPTACNPQAPVTGCP